MTGLNQLLCSVLPCSSADWLDEEPTTSEPAEIIRQIALVEKKVLMRQVPGLANQISAIVHQLHEDLLARADSGARNGGSPPLHGSARLSQISALKHAPAIVTFSALCAFVLPLLGILPTFTSAVAILLPLAAIAAIVGVVTGMSVSAAKRGARTARDLRPVYKRALVLNALAALLSIMLLISASEVTLWPCTAMILLGSLAHVALYTVEHRRRTMNRAERDKTGPGEAPNSATLIIAAQNQLDEITAKMPAALRESCLTQRAEGVRNLAKRGTLAEFHESDFMPHAPDGNSSASYPLGSFLMGYAVFCAEQHDEPSDEPDPFLSP